MLYRRRVSVCCDGIPAATFLTKQSAREFIRQHSLEMRRRLTIRLKKEAICCAKPLK